MKNNFLLPTSARESIKALDDVDAGKLIKALFDYAATGEYELDGPLIAFFIQLRQGIDKNEASYRAKVKNLENNVEKGKNAASKKQEEIDEQNDSISKTSEIESKSRRNQSESKTNANKSKRNRNEIEMKSNGNTDKIASDARHNTYIHNINNLDNIDTLKERNNKRKKSASKNQEKKSKSIYELVIDYLNEKAGTTYKSTSKKTRELIDARLNEKFGLAHFLKVIDNKCSEWKDTNFEKFLRPSTLFGSKFEEYFNQKNMPSGNKAVKKASTIPSWMNNADATKAEPMTEKELAELEESFKEFSQVQIDDNGNLTEGQLPF